MQTVLSLSANGWVVCGCDNFCRFLREKLFMVVTYANDRHRTIHINCTNKQWSHAIPRNKPQTENKKLITDVPYLLGNETINSTERFVIICAQNTHSHLRLFNIDVRGYRREAPARAKNECAKGLVDIFGNGKGLNR